jgi:hypothetical protein
MLTSAALLVTFASLASAIYLPGVAPKEFDKGAQVRRSREIWRCHVWLVLPGARLGGPSLLRCVI